MKPSLKILAMAAVLFSSCKKITAVENPPTDRFSNTGLQTIKSKPNIIIILLDDIGYEVPAYTGGQSYYTPNIDALAAGGRQFSCFYASALCSPSRFMLLTGKYNSRNYTEWGVMDTSQKTIANLLKTQGYKTCASGKWQLAGGDASVKAFGFDSYMLYDAFNGDDHPDTKYNHLCSQRQFKDPCIYTNNGFMADSEIVGKYGEDFFRQHLFDFIDSNKTKPFFAIYSNNVVASDFSPTPDDPAFASWNPDNPEDKTYFPGMVAYQDKMVNKILQKLRADGIENNTCIIFVGDNATSKKIVSTYNGEKRNGGKNLTNKRGTQTPLFVYWPARIIPGQRKSTLIDFTDMLPTIADIAGIPKPGDYGTLDGTSFYDNMVGNRIVKDRSWVFAHWDNSPTDTKVPIRYVNDANYKLYDTLQNSRFFNVKKDPEEKSPIPDSKLTPQEVQIKANFKAVLSTMHN